MLNRPQLSSSFFLQFPATSVDFFPSIFFFYKVKNFYLFLQENYVSFGNEYLKKKPKGYLNTHTVVPDTREGY